VNKLFLYGTSGSGKSRCIYEIVRERIADFKNIFIINPRHTVGAKESGRIKLTELFSRFSNEDAVIWDNFPDDIINTDLDSARSVLEELSEKGNAKCLLVALKPKYLEIYREIANKIFELSVHEITYNNDNFKNIIRSYGDSIEQ